jgi:hypothetical protein
MIFNLSCIPRFFIREIPRILRGAMIIAILSLCAVQVPHNLQAQCAKSNGAHGDNLHCTTRGGCGSDPATVCEVFLCNAYNTTIEACEHTSRSTGDPNVDNYTDTCEAVELACNSTVACPCGSI